MEASGFKKALKTGFDLPDNGLSSVDFRLEVGAVTEVPLPVPGGRVQSAQSRQFAEFAGDDYGEQLRVVDGLGAGSEFAGRVEGVVLRIRGVGDNTLG